MLILNIILLLWDNIDIIIFNKQLLELVHGNILIQLNQMMMFKKP